jgi:Holliday junction resolvasome RuvABC endonuclease subunit
MSHASKGIVLLALDTGVRETGWAVFKDGNIEATGFIKVSSRHRIDAADRVKHLVKCLDDLVEQWDPATVACCQPTGIGWRVPALELLDSALADWSRRHWLGLYAYSAQEVRTAVAGHPNASRGDLGYAVMVRFGLIGHSKTTHEWEAIAVGDYHLSRWATGPENSCNTGKASKNGRN